MDLFCSCVPSNFEDQSLAINDLQKSMQNIMQVSESAIKDLYARVHIYTHHSSEPQEINLSQFHSTIFLSEESFVKKILFKSLDSI